MWFYPNILDAHNWVTKSYDIWTFYNLNYIGQLFFLKQTKTWWFRDTQTISQIQIAHKVWSQN